MNHNQLKETFDFFILLSPKLRVCLYSLLRCLKQYSFSLTAHDPVLRSTIKRVSNNIKLRYTLISSRNSTRPVL